MPREVAGLIKGDVKVGGELRVDGVKRTATIDKAQATIGALKMLGDVSFSWTNEAAGPVKGSLKGTVGCAAIAQSGIRRDELFVVTKCSSGNLAPDQVRRAFDEPDAWGILLADVARHVARLYAKEQVMAEEQALARVRLLFDAEMDSPTDPGSTSAIS